MRFSAKLRFVFCVAVFFCAGALTAQAADPVVVEVHYQNGVKFYNRGLYDRAIAEFEKTLSLEPDHAEARDFLEKAKEAKSHQKAGESAKSKTGELQSLYDEGKRLYAQRDYEAAIDIFDKILAVKPVDDFASFYKERCEIFISRQLSRQKKLEEKNKAKENKERDALNRKEAAQAKKDQKSAVLENRREIDEERRALAQEKIRKQEPQDLEKEDKKTRQRQEAEEKRRARNRAREEERAAAEKQREVKRALRAQKPVESEKKEMKIEKVTATPETRQAKELFLRGVEEYGRKDYETAIATFESVVAAESSSRKLYTNASRRLMEKARKKMEAAKK